MVLPVRHVLLNPAALLFSQRQYSKNRLVLNTLGSSYWRSRSKSTLCPQFGRRPHLSLPTLPAGAAGVRFEPIVLKNSCLIEGRRPDSILQMGGRIGGDGNTAGGAFGAVL